MRPHTGEWDYKSPAQIGYEVGFYDFANDALDAEHADTTFKDGESVSGYTSIASDKWV
jgi:hypothetical protein